MKLTNRDIRVIHGGLSVLSARTLPSLSSDLKVAALLRRFFNVPYQVTQDALQKLMAALPPPKDLGDGKMPRWLVEERERRFAEEVLDQEQDVGDIPDTLLVNEKDLPLALKGENGEANRQGVADIVTALGPMYDWPKE